MPTLASSHLTAHLAHARQRTAGHPHARAVSQEFAADTGASMKTIPLNPLLSLAALVLLGPACTLPPPAQRAIKTDTTVTCSTGTEVDGGAGSDDGTTTFVT